MFMCVWWGGDEIAQCLSDVWLRRSGVGTIHWEMSLPKGSNVIGKRDITTELIDACLEHMMNEWTRLLYLTIKSENPGFEMIQSFKVLALKHDVLEKLMDDHKKGAPAHALGDPSGRCKHDRLFNVCCTTGSDRKCLQ